MKLEKQISGWECRQCAERCLGQNIQVHSSPLLCWQTHTFLEGLLISRTSWNLDQVCQFPISLPMIIPPRAELGVLRAYGPPIQLDCSFLELSANRRAYSLAIFGLETLVEPDVQTPSLLARHLLTEGQSLCWTLKCHSFYFQETQFKCL